MTLYTPLSEHDIFPQENKDGKVVYENYKNCKVKCLDQGDGKKQIIQVFSTNPNDYMDPTLQPGQWLGS
ncbi:YlzJ-like family protein [Halobacillus amylolyticus]|uniref:YlzJ-like family protein n=1 Tax=Halobacillus amylolyticus TaxID=2932259 RepID=A0ABY4HCP7_9BACI|nr:YlzJ-like family protein [Halobacillus amylolyticus]UOR12669.1 YlzJ-like family protein [Halobacillus amylolyticus]